MKILESVFIFISGCSDDYVFLILEGKGRGIPEPATGLRGCAEKEQQKTQRHAKS